MKISWTIVLFGMWSWGSSYAFMNLDYFNAKIKPFCSGHRTNDNSKELINGQQLPTPNTIESFIGLVESLEMLHPEWRPVEILKILLINFRYDDAIVKGNSVSTRGSAGGVSRYYEILIKLFKNPSMGQQLREHDLSQDDKCALYYMISHTVNDTIRPGEDETIEVNGNQLPKYLREQGVLTLSSQSTHAFALGKVLLGLLAGLERTDPASASQIFNEVKHNSNNNAPSYLENVLINVLYAATFGDIISVTKESLKENLVQSLDPFFFKNGFWKEEVCPVHYLLEANHFIERHASFSLIRGATDGYKLGMKMKDMMNSNAKLRLSQVLRMYYSGEGFPENRALSWCSRRDLILNNFRQEAIDFDKLYSAVTDKVIEEPTIAQGVDRILSYMESENSRIYDEASRDGNKCDFRDVGGTHCETPTHLLAILDMKSREQREQQSEIVGNLSSGMQMGKLLASSVSVYTNLKPYGGGYQLDTAINSSSVSGCGGCTAKHYDPQRANYENEQEVFRDLNITLGHMGREAEENPGVPAKVVLYFNYGSPTADWHLQKALNEIRWRHRSAKLLVFGSRKDVLRIFADNEDIETEMTSMKMDALKEKVCKVPAQFQYHNCYRRDEALERGEKFEGVISARRIQYWMMDPKYFLKSYHIKLIFRATTGEIRVCFSRDYSRIFNFKEPNGADCQKSSAHGEEILFEVVNPCHRRTEASCDPFYFFIEGKSAPKDNEHCKELTCRTLDQISYEFRHEGVSCNNAQPLFSTKQSVLMVVVITMTILKISSISRFIP